MSKRYSGFFSCVAVAGFAMMCLTQNVQAQPKYTITDLGRLGGTYSLGQGINSSGQTVGNAYTTGDVAPHAFRTAANSAIKPTDDLSTLGGSYSIAQGINTSGQVVGYAYTVGDIAAHAFRTAANSAIKPSDDLGTLGGTYTSALAINNSGQVV